MTIVAAATAAGNTWFDKQLVKAKASTRKVGDLKTGIDSRKDGTINEKIVSEIVSKHNSAADYKYTTYITEDGYYLTNRHGARALAYQLVLDSGVKKQDVTTSLIDASVLPVMVVPVTYGSLKNPTLTPEQQMEVVAFAIRSDIPTDDRRGLEQEDLATKIQWMVDQGATKEAVVSLLQTRNLKKWRIEKLYSAALNVITNRNLAAARAEGAEMVKAGKPVNFQKLAEKHGLPAKKAVLIAAPRQHSDKMELAIGRLWERQSRTQNAKEAVKQYADNNMRAYLESLSGSRPGKRLMTPRRLRQITQKHLDCARQTVRLWEEALGRVEGEIGRSE